MPAAGRSNPDDRDREPPLTKTQYYCAASLDGFIADADHGLDWLLHYEGSFDHEAAEPGPMSDGGGYEDFYADVGAMVSGSATYEFVVEHFSDAWPYAGKPYWVLSSRDLPLPRGEGADVRIVQAAVADLYDEMIAAAGRRNLWVVGGGDVASQFADEGLLDELLLTVVPVVLGSGKPLFDRSPPGGALRLTGSRLFDNGMAELRYAFDRAPGPGEG